MGTSQKIYDRISILNLLQDLGGIFEQSVSSDPDWESLNSRMHSEETRSVLSLITQGKTFCDSISTVMRERHFHLGMVFFGSIMPQYFNQPPSSFIIASNNAHRLILRFGLKEEDECLYIQKDDSCLLTVIVETDLNHFVFRQLSTGTFLQLEPFLKMDQIEMANGIASVGSIWSIVFPTHRAIITRTVSLSIPQLRSGILFDPHRYVSDDGRTLNLMRQRRHSSSEHQALKRLEAAFGCSSSVKQSSKRSVQLMSIEDIRKRLSDRGDRKTRILFETSKGKHIFRMYAPPHSDILNFNEASYKSDPNRLDYVLTYKPTNGSSEFHRDFIVSLDDWSCEETELYRATFDILHTLAIRRSGLFRLGFAQRVYTILLPPAVLQLNTQPEFGYFFLSCLILYQVPQRGIFRRTFTLSHIAIPVFLNPSNENDSCSLVRRIGQPRPAVIDEIHAFLTDIKSPIEQYGTPSKAPYVIADGPLAELVGIPTGPISIQQLTERVTTFTVAKMLQPKKSVSSIVPISPDLRNISDDATTIAFKSSLESRLSTVLIQVDWQTPPGDAQPWEKWLTTGKDSSLNDNVYKLMFYKDFLNPRSGYTSIRSVDLVAMLVGNKFRTDMNGITFFDPSTELKMIIYPRMREQYPNYSIIRWMAFSLYAESALSSLQGMIQRFYLLLGRQGDLGIMVETLDDMTQSFAELYDLDIRLYLYRQEYEQLREMLKVDRDYNFLIDKLSSVMEDATLREQRLFNKLLVAFTVSTATIGILSAVSQIEGWSLQKYLPITLPMSIALVIGAYCIFDPVRRLLSRIK